MSDLQFAEVLFGSPGYQECLELRSAILRRPLGLAFTPEDSEQDRRDYHLACRLGEGLVGCLVLTPKASGEIKMRQVAVVPELQGQGIGRSLVQYSEEFALDRGFSTMTLHARETAVQFYTRLGYEVIGEPFVEVSVPHRAMRKILAAGA